MKFLKSGFFHFYFIFDKSFILLISLELSFWEQSFRLWRKSILNIDVKNLLKDKHWLSNKKWRIYWSCIQTAGLPCGQGRSTQLMHLALLTPSGWKVSRRSPGRTTCQQHRSQTRSWHNQTKSLLSPSTVLLSQRDRQISRHGYICLACVSPVLALAHSRRPQQVLETKANGAETPTVLNNCRLSRLARESWCGCLHGKELLMPKTGQWHQNIPVPWSCSSPPRVWLQTDNQIHVRRALMKLKMTNFYQVLFCGSTSL